MFRSTAGQRSNRRDDVIIGMAQFQKSLHGLETKGIEKALRTASRQAAKPILAAMRADVKPISKTMARALGVKVKIYKRSKNAIALVGIRNTPSVRRPYSSRIQRSRGKGDSRGIHDPRFTFHLVDLGTKPHQAKAFGKAYFAHPGTKANSIREKAMRSAAGKSDAAYIDAFRRAVDEVIG